MNANRIYSQHRDDALAKQGEAASYETFVAMPFREGFGYRATRVMEEVIIPAAHLASQRQGVGGKHFTEPARVDAAPQVANEISEEIVVGILFAHLFLADLTLLNPNVLLEVGIALGLKPTPQLILLLDGDPGQLPFDIKDNAVLRYDTAGAIDRIADALLAASASFEREYSAHVTEVAARLTSDAIFTLRVLADQQRQVPPQPIHGDLAGQIFGGDPNARLRYNFVEKELLLHRLVRMEHEVIPGGDRFGLHATALGRRVIEVKWPQQPVAAQKAIPAERQSKPRPRRGA